MWCFAEAAQRKFGRFAFFLFASQFSTEVPVIFDFRVRFGSRRTFSTQPGFIF
jgi:hypothetical protein